MFARNISFFKFNFNKKVMKFNIFKIILLLSISSVFFLESCRKDIDDFRPYPPIKTQIEPLVLGGGKANPILDSIKLKPIKGKISCNGGGRINVNSNVFVRFKPNACVDSSGKVCTGFIDVEIIYIIKRGDMIRMNMPTIAPNGQLIGSAGEVLVKTYQNGKPVYDNQNIFGAIEVNIKNPNPNYNMKVFDAQNVGTSDFAWLVNNKVDMQFAILDSLQGTTKTETGYSFLCKAFQWINCDYFYKVNDPKTTVCVQMLDSVYTNQNTKVFAVFPNEKIVCSFHTNYSKGKFCSYDNSIPIGEKIVIVTMAIKKSGTTVIYVVGTASTTVTKDLVIPITTKDMTEAEFLAFLATL
jgi:hypothetical protein